VGNNDVDAAMDYLVRQLLGAFATPAGIMEFDLDVLAFRIAERTQPSPERVSERMWGRRRHQNPDARQFSRLLRECST